MIPLERAVVARLESHGEKFEILVDPDLAVRYRQGDPIELEDMVAALSVFENASRGTRASDEALAKVFATTISPRSRTGSSRKERSISPLSSAGR